MKTIKILPYILCVLAFMGACKKEDTGTGSSSYLNLKMTDAPGEEFDAVYIDLEAIKVTNETGQSYLVTANPGRYNLAELTNGKVVILANGALQGEEIAKVSLILGDDNTVVIDEQTFNLRTSDAEAGLTVVVNKKLNAGENDLLLDFDVGQSVIRNGSDFFLRPVIRVVDVEFTGAIKGRIKPAHAFASITAVGDGGTFTTLSSVGECDHENWQGEGHGHHGYHDWNWDGWEDDDDDDGHGHGNGHGHGHGHHSHNGFFLPAMPAGTYTVTIVGRDAFNTTVILSNVVVKTGEVTNLGKITL